jgi:hypothetical protein
MMSAPLSTPPEGPFANATNREAASLGSFAPSSKKIGPEESLDIEQQIPISCVVGEGWKVEW